MNEIEYGLLKNTSVQVHVHPDLFDTNETGSNNQVSESPLGVFVDIQSDTLQVPVGVHSMLHAVKGGDQSAFDGMVYLGLNAFSNWDSGLSHSKSIRNLAKLFRVSPQYVQQTEKRLEDKWIHRVSGKHKAGKFQLLHHLSAAEDTPLDGDGRPLKCAMPRGEGGIFERLEAGDIHWKSALIWMLFKEKSDWRTGITDPISISDLQKWTRFGRSAICGYIKELMKAGMLERLPRKGNDASVYQLYPRPYPQKRERQPEQERTFREMRVVNGWGYSYNHQYRINLETDEIQYRPNRKERFKRISDYHRYHEMPKAILIHFEMRYNLYQQLKARQDE